MYAPVVLPRRSRPTRAATARRALAIAALCLGGLGLAACGSGEPPPPPLPTGPIVTESLLERAPDQRVADLERLTPTLDDGWGEFTGGGWSHRGIERDDRVAVPTKLPQATLRLPVAHPSERVVRFDLAVAGGGGPTQVELELNGELVASFTADAETSSYRYVLPASWWGRGINELTFRASRADGSRPSLAVHQLTYGADDEARRGADEGVLLAPDETLAWVVTNSASGRLVLRADDEVEGALELRLRSVRPRTGERASVPALNEIYEGFELAQGLEIELPPAVGPIAELSLTWRADPGRRLTLERFDLGRRTPGRELPLETPPLVVFLSVDTLSAPHMSLYGYERPTTPELEALAEESVLFEHCTANSSWTVPSYLAQFTGLLAESSRVEPDLPDGRRPIAWELFQLAPSRTSLAELMRAAGYRTVGIVDNHWLTQIPGIRQGFDQFDTEPAEIDLTRVEGGMRLVFARAREELARWDGERPLFLFLQILDVHGPYMTVPPWRDSFRSDEPGPMVPVVSNWNLARGTVQQYLVEPTLPPGEPLPEVVPVNPLHDAYDEKVLEMDAHVGELVDALRRDGFLDQALFVFSADHGESTLDREIYFRHKSVHETTTHVPLLMRLPGGAEGGRRIDEHVQLLDLYPTFAELIGLEPRELHLHGQSLLPALFGEELRTRPAIVEVDYLEQRAVVFDGWKLIMSRPWAAKSLEAILSVPRYWELFAEAEPELAAELAGTDDLRRPPRFDQARYDAFKRRHKAARWKLNALLRARGLDVELYDLENDPAEQVDLSEQHPERVEALLELVAVAAGESAFARAEVADDAVEVEVDQESKAALAELGYIELDEGGAADKRSSDPAEGEAAERPPRD